MPIVAYGYGVDSTLGGGQTFVLTDDVVIALMAEPEITVNDDITITAPTDDIDISVEPEIDIEVE